MPGATLTVTNPLRALADVGQAVWLDYIRRNLITSGELRRLIDEDGLAGLTSNPSIFEKAVTGSTDYADLLSAPDAAQLEPKVLYERIAIRDIQDAADLLRPVYERTRRRDGYVSLEVSPDLAHDTTGTLAEARRLWQAVARENVLIKVPGTEAGIPAIEQLISEGININVTLLFAQSVYARVANAYIAGLEQRAARGEDVSRIASVASFFVSRIDTMIDAQIEARLKASGAGGQRALLQTLQGKVAIANAKLAYQIYRELCASARWRALAERGAQTQRLLWASTSTKNPKFRDVLYVEELIGPDTVNTIPPATLDAFRDHGRVRVSLSEDVEEAQDVMETLAKVDISMEQVTDQLVADGVRLFADAFDKLLKAVDRRGPCAPAKVNRTSYQVPAPLADEVQASLRDWTETHKVRRLWARDGALWTGRDEANWLGWLGITEDQRAHLQHFADLAQEVRREGFTHAVLLGMGGSSLCPEVLRATFGHQAGFPDLRVLDSTDPAQVRSIESGLDLRRTLFIVSSKSGSTLEPNIFKQYFFERVRQAVGARDAGRRFIAITDPGSKLQSVAESDGFRHVYLGLPSIGGRYSALSNFGMIPAAIMGLDVARFLDRADEMVHACSSCVPTEQNPGVVLGTVLGVAARHGRDKVTLVTSPGIRTLGAWLEQLLAESTGKNGRGLIPVHGERLAPPEVYGGDRMFAYLRLDSAPDAAQDAALAALERAGQPVYRIAIADPYDLGQEFFRWELATAVAGAILGINAFDQPDVEASKVATRKLTAQVEQTGRLPAETPLYTEGNLQLFTDERNAGSLRDALGASPSLTSYLRAHLARITPGDYFALLGYVEMNEPHEQALQALRHAVRDRKRVATCLGFGPRFLHSTGQAYKGGPNTGVFLQVTCDDAADLAVPGQKYTFGVVKTAQARGDFQVLAERGRRALRIHVGKDVRGDLARLKVAVDQALA